MRPLKLASTSVNRPVAFVFVVEVARFDCCDDDGRKDLFAIVE